MVLFRYSSLMADNSTDSFLFDIAFEQSLMHSAMNLAIAERDHALQVGGPTDDHPPAAQILNKMYQISRDTLDGILVIYYNDHWMIQLSFLRLKI